MSLTVNGVAIPETEGAIKVGATNVQKVVVNDTTVWEVPQECTISWDKSLAQFSSFINSTSPASSTTSNYGGKQIRYTKPDGSTAVANPYQAGSITIRKGTKVYLDLFAGSGTDKSYVGWYVGNTRVGYNTGASGKLCSREYMPTASGKLTYKVDVHLSSTNKYQWYVTIDEST